MKNRTFAASISLAALLLFAAGAQARHAQNQTPAQDSAAGTMGSGMMQGGMMGRGMEGMHAMGSEMMANHRRMQQLITQLMDNMTALRAEKNAAARDKLMSQQEALLEKTQDRMMRQGNTMAVFMKNCPMFNANRQPPAK